MLLDYEPPYFTKEYYYKILDEIIHLGVNDLTIQTNTPAMATLHGKQKVLTKRSFSSNEAEDFVNLLYGSNAMAKILSGEDLDFSYTLKMRKDNHSRFRVNATLISQLDKFGVQVSLRVLSVNPPDISTLSLPDEILEMSHIQQGIVLVCGETGSGKSTLLTSMLKLRAYQSEYGEKIITFESPIEYILPAFINQSVIAQSEIPRCLDSYAYAIRNALRRTPTAIMVGEARDKDTILAVIEAALTGHSLFSTLHSQSVGHAIHRLLMLIPSELKNRVCYDFFSMIQAVIWQKLLPVNDGTRVALREYIIIDDKLRNRLMHADLKDISTYINDAICQDESSMYHSAQNLLKQGLISHETCIEYTKFQNRRFYVAT